MVNLTYGISIVIVYNSKVYKSRIRQYINIRKIIRARRSVNDPGGAGLIIWPGLNCGACREQGCGCAELRPERSAGRSMQGPSTDLSASIMMR
jgi:hypothetical protein